MPTKVHKEKERKRKKRKHSSLPFSENEEGNEGKEQDGMKKNSVPDYCLNPATHNYRGLLERLQIIGVNDQKEIDTILRLSDYGRIGERVWKLIAVGNWPRGNIIKLPGRYLISQLRKKLIQGGIDMELNNDFSYGPMSKTELALLYFPERNSLTARRMLNTWIIRHKVLYGDLLKSGYTSKNILLTPAQVRLIIRYLGEP